jgi:hypothetical protein
MHEPDDDARRLERYLLGQLPEEESDRLEERLLAEDDLFELAEAVEGDLLAAWAAGELEGAEREAAARLATSPRGRRAAALARGLAMTAREEAVWGAPAAAAPGEGAPVVPFRPGPAPVRPLLRLALAASLAAALGATGWLLLEGRAQREAMRAREARGPSTEQREITRRETELRRLDRRRGPLGGRSRERVAELPRAPQPSEKAPGGALPVPTPAQKGETRRAAAPEATLLLSLATLRSGAAAPRLALPPGVERVRLEVDLGATADEPAAYARYRAALRDARGKEVWQGEDLAPGRDGVLHLKLPASALAPGRYELAVQGVTAEGGVEDLGFPELEIARP